MQNSGSASQRWISPLVYLASNWISLLGVVILTTTGILWMFLLPGTLRGNIGNPYLGIAQAVLLPGILFLGLLLVPVGILVRRRKEKSHGTYPTSFQTLNFQNPAFRRLVVFIGVTTFANVVIGSQLSYQAVNYMESDTFCGATCHVMKPEFTAWKSAPHANVECVECHTRPGATGFVASKLAGSRQLYELVLSNYPRPIKAPVHTREVASAECQKCHWKDKPESDRLRMINSYSDDEKTKLTKTALLMKLADEGNSHNIHGAHMRNGRSIRFAVSDDQRHVIPWVELTVKGGQATVFRAADAKGDLPGAFPVHEMTCLDCHNRPAHTLQTPDGAVDQALFSGAIDPALPFAKKWSVEVLKSAKSAGEVPAMLASRYQQANADRDKVTHAGAVLQSIYERNVFPEMRVTWDTYPTNLGHEDNFGCFRCHDDNHVADGGQRKIGQDCETCHHMMDAAALAK